MKIPVVRLSLNHKEQNFFGPPKFIAQLRLWVAHTKDLGVEDKLRFYS